MCLERDSGMGSGEGWAQQGRVYNCARISRDRRFGAHDSGGHRAGADALLHLKPRGFQALLRAAKNTRLAIAVSLGVSGIKEDTANAIEAHANDPTSPFYPGAGSAALIAYPAGVDHDAELYNRLTDAKDHYYSLLYTALYIQEIEAQWQRAGYDISNNPGAIVTLFNIGFVGSHPNASPRAAGAAIEAGGKTYVYGQLGAEFYNSNELLDVLPR